jgi:hypothetical protein
MRKLNNLIAVGIVFLLISAVSASYWIYSNKVFQKIPPAKVTLNPTTYDGETIAISGTLKDGNDNPLVGKTVGIYTNATSDISGHLTQSIANVITLSDGTFSYSWSQTADGTYYFEARYSVP